MEQTPANENAPPTEEEIKALWKKCRFDVWRYEGFRHGRAVEVAFDRAPSAPWRYNPDAALPVTTHVHRVAFSVSRLNVRVLNKHGEGYWNTTVYEVRGNGVLVERSTAGKGVF